MTWDAETVYSEDVYAYRKWTRFENNDEQIDQAKFDSVFDFLKVYRFRKKKQGLRDDQHMPNTFD